MKKESSPIALLVNLGEIIAAAGSQFGIAHVAIAPYTFGYVKQEKAGAAQKKIDYLTWVKQELADVAQSLGNGGGVENLVGKINAEIAELEAIAAQTKPKEAVCQYS